MPSSATAGLCPSQAPTFPTRVLFPPRCPEGPWDASRELSGAVGQHSVGALRVPLWLLCRPCLDEKAGLPTGARVTSSGWKPRGRLVLGCSPAAGGYGGRGLHVTFLLWRRPGTGSVGPAVTQRPHANCHHERGAAHVTEARGRPASGTEPIWTQGSSAGSASGGRGNPPPCPHPRTPKAAASVSAGDCCSPTDRRVVSPVSSSSGSAGCDRETSFPLL